MADLKREPPARETRLAAIQPGFGDLASFELMQRGAKVLAASSLVPEAFRGAEGLPNAIVALNMALRMQADPLMVMQNLYVVHGRPAWSAQFLIATINRSGRYSALRYAWQGERGKPSWGCRAWALELATGDRIEGPLVTMQTATDEGWINRSGSKWKTIPELMLTYRAAAWFVRTNAPEVAMGLPTAEEVDDVVTITPQQYTEAQIKGGEHARQSTDTPPIAADQPTPAGMTFAQVADAIGHATTVDGLSLARDLIRSVADETQQVELRALAEAKAKDVS
jgi:hypothetical protein